jgi:hypothetical protein
MILEGTFCNFVYKKSEICKTKTEKNLIKYFNLKIQISIQKYMKDDFTGLQDPGGPKAIGTQNELVGPGFKHGVPSLKSYK